MSLGEIALYERSAKKQKLPLKDLWEYDHYAKESQEDIKPGNTAMPMDFIELLGN